jgi:hypothetical protein
MACITAQSVIGSAIRAVWLCLTMDVFPVEALFGYYSIEIRNSQFSLTFLLDTQARDCTSNHQLLDFRRALEDRVNLCVSVFDRKVRVIRCQVDVLSQNLDRGFAPLLR